MAKSQNGKTAKGQIRLFAFSAFLASLAFSPFRDFAFLQKNYENKNHRSLKTHPI